MQFNFECVDDKRWLILLLLKVFLTAVLHSYVKWPGLSKEEKAHIIFCLSKRKQTTREQQSENDSGCTSEPEKSPCSSTSSF